jgi:hypothetical protein
MRQISADFDNETNILENILFVELGVLRRISE